MDSEDGSKNGEDAIEEEEAKVEMTEAEKQAAL